MKSKVDLELENDVEVTIRSQSHAMKLNRIRRSASLLYYSCKQIVSWNPHLKTLVRSNSACTKLPSVSRGGVTFFCDAHCWKATAQNFHYFMAMSEFSAQFLNMDRILRDLIGILIRGIPILIE
jgi:hypothetical protein